MRAAQHFGVTSFHPDSIGPIPVTLEHVHVDTRVAVCLHLCLHTPGQVLAASTATDIRFPATHTTYVHDVLPLPTNYSVISMISSLSLTLFLFLKADVHHRIPRGARPGLFPLDRLRYDRS